MSNESARAVARALAGAVLSVVALGQLLAWAESAATASAPLVVNGKSHVVVMEYEAWFGPKAVTFQGFSALPLLQSADMQAVGGGYDSADPAVIRQHVRWLESMGVDAAISEVTNNVSCIFNSEWFVKKYIRNCTPSFRAYNRQIRDNTGNLYPAWSALGTRMKLIPLLGGSEGNVLIKDQDGKTAFEKEADFFGVLLHRYPNLASDLPGQAADAHFSWRGAGSKSCRPSSLVSPGAVSRKPSGDWREIHFQADGGISRQPTGFMGIAGHAQRAG